MRKYLIVFLSIFLSLQAFAEKLKRKAQLYEEPSKRTIAQLEADVPVTILEETNGWLKIITTANCSFSNFDENTLELERKTILRGEDGAQIGQVYGKWKLPGLYWLEYQSFSGKPDVFFEVIGYVRKSDIDENMIPENRFTFLIDSAKSKITLLELHPELDKFNFKQVTNDSGFIAYQLNDIRGLDYDNPIERLKLIFYEERLVAIFHKKPFPLKTKEVIQIDGRENLIYLRDLSPDEKRVFGDLFLEN